MKYTLAFIVFCLFAYNGYTQLQETNPIRINQLGFYSYAPKTAIVVGNTTADHFYVIGLPGTDTIY
ncbi:MAG TPA: cellulase N-terminal Ig-like domain-containing protein, partial [Chitinophagaceae bacterium]|nr:cellulase N-terminal Ig-like domain-containing protein [Chitinophagaceae bacterium]